jgi:hypothetical protein
MGNMRLFGWGLMVLLISSARAAEVPAGTPIEVRLESKLSSNQSKAGDEVRAAVIAPVIADGKVVIPAGSTIIGKVKQAQPSTNGQDRASLALEFGEIAATNGKPAKLAAKISSIDNARESVDESGRIWGILASETLTAQIDKGLEKLGQKSSGLAEVLQVAKSAVLKQAETEIGYGPGSEMTLVLTQKLALNGAKMDSGYRDPKPVGPQDELVALVNREPFRSRALKPPQPSDITNIMLIGSQQAVEAAFAAAGWHIAAALGKRSGLETFRAIAEGRGYAEAPVSILLLDDKKPDLVFQKQNNTFAKRHHLRIWQRPDTFDGQSVWVVAATHDIDIEFSPESRTFIHKIDPQIGRERAKVVSDLLATRMVQGLALVDRPEVPTESQNATGDKLETDGAMAVLELAAK